MSIKNLKISTGSKLAILTLVVIGIFIAGVTAAQNQNISVQDGMGTTYNFDVQPDIKTVYYDYQDYSGRVNESGYLKTTDSRFLVEEADNSVFAVFMNNSTLKVICLSATTDYPSSVGKIITLDTNLASMVGNNVQIFSVRKYGIYVSWTKNNETYYAIIDRWYGLRDKGNSNEAAQNGIILPEPLEQDNTDDVTSTIDGTSVVIVIDSSGSMAGEKIKTAKEEVTKLVNKLSKTDDEAALFMFTYCGTVPMLQGFTQDYSKILNALDQATAQGGASPVAESIEKGKNYLENNHHGEKGKLVIYTDGGENCSGDPIAAASSLKSASIDIDFKIVGYNLETTAKDELKKITKAGGGKLDTEKVIDIEASKAEAKNNAKKAAGAATAGVAGTLFAYWTSGGFNFKQRFDSLFGQNGLFKMKKTTSSQNAKTPKTKEEQNAEIKDEAVNKATKKDKPDVGKKFCTSCGNQLAIGANFCTNCGKKNK
ncbi:MAG: VWA domain-containing protein [bacterium]